MGELFWTQPDSNGFYIFQNELSCKLEKTPLCYSKNYQILHADRLEDKEQLSLWNQVQIWNRIWIKNPGSWTDFEFDSNLLGVQTCLEWSDKFPKFLICLDLPECEFLLAWSYGKIWSFHTCPY
jgi:hypothetical protein